MPDRCPTPFPARTALAIAAALAVAAGLGLLAEIPVAHAQTPTAEPQRVRVGSLLIDRTEVTIAQFARFTQATDTVTRAEREGGGFEYAGGWQRRPGWTWRTPDGVPPAYDLLPAVHVTHAEAEAYCRWAGGPVGACPRPPNGSARPIPNSGPSHPHLSHAAPPTPTPRGLHHKVPTRMAATHGPALHPPAPRPQA